MTQRIPVTDDAPQTDGAMAPIDDRGGFLVRRLNQIWSGLLQRRFREAGYNVTSVQFAALEMIAQGDSLDQTDLALRLGYDRATTGGMISRLERDGLVQRVANPKDKRARLVTATTRGAAAAAELSSIAKAADRELLESIEDKDQAALFGLLRKLVETGEQFEVAPSFRAVGRSSKD
ncbi:MAG: MarR family transcriptional regulator [Rhodobacteraceae bacterium]|nr:MarR family transcriptional regulator [Paracoccaceae bacterium]